MEAFESRDKFQGQDTLRTHLLGKETPKSHLRFGSETLPRSRMLAITESEAMGFGYRKGRTIDGASEWEEALGEGTRSSERLASLRDHTPINSSRTK